MTTPDYSNYDQFDINNRLFRLARNNIEKTSTPIKSLEEEEKKKEEKNLIFYGSEFINNLKQINYTFSQIDDFILKPPSELKKRILEKSTKSAADYATIPNVESKGSALSRFKVDELKDIIRSSGLRIPFTGLRKDDLIKVIISNDLNFGDYKGSQLKIIDAPQSKLTQEESDDNFKKIFDKNKEGIRSIESKRGPSGVPNKVIPLLPRAEVVPDVETIDRSDWVQFEPIMMYNPIYRDRDYTKSELRSFISKLTVEGKRINNEIKEESKRDNIQSIDDASPELLNKIEYLKFLENELEFIQSKSTVGAGRKKKSSSPEAEFQANEARKMFSGNLDIRVPTDVIEEEEAKEENEILQETKEDYIVERAPAQEIRLNNKASENLDQALVNAISIVESDKLDKNTLIAVETAKSEAPVRLTKIYDLMTELIRFIGRTTILYISKIKMNLNYLDEDQIKLIYDNTQELKKNIQVISRFQDKGTAPIKDTLYNQLEKETSGLYKEINDSIRNISRLKDYNVLEGAGIGGRRGGPYNGAFIEPETLFFINHSSRKRLL